MKNKLFSAVLICASNATMAKAQKIMEFEDGTSIALSGTEVEPYIKYNDFNVSEIKQDVQSFYKMDGNTLKISILGELKSILVELNIYRIHKNQIYPYYISVEEQTNHEEVYCSLNFLVNEGSKFDSKHYVSTNSEAENVKIRNFRVCSDQKSGIETFYNFLIK